MVKRKKKKKTVLRLGDFLGMTLGSALLVLGTRAHYLGLDKGRALIIIAIGTFFNIVSILKEEK